MMTRVTIVFLICVASLRRGCLRGRGLLAGRRWNRRRGRASSSDALQREEVLEVLVDQVGALGPSEDLVVHFVVQAGTDHVRCLPVLAENGEEPGDVTLRLVHALGGIALGFLDCLVGLTAGLGDGLVVGFLALVDQPAPVLDGLVDVFEGVLHRALGRDDVLQLHRRDADAQSIGLVQFIHQLLALHLDVRALGADDVEDCAVTDEHVDD